MYDMCQDEVDGTSMWGINHSGVGLADRTHDRLPGSVRFYYY